MERYSNSNSKTIYVPSGCVGRIIGAKGSKIMEIQDISQAKIQVHREEESDGKKPITISGSPEQIERAEMLIDECVQYDNRAPRGPDRRDERRGDRGDRGCRGRDF